MFWTRPPREAATWNGNAEPAATQSRVNGWGSSFGVGRKATSDVAPQLRPAVALRGRGIWSRREVFVPQQGVIGLIGGMSWESSAEYYRIINQAVRQRLGGL